MKFKMTFKTMWFFCITNFLFTVVYDDGFLGFDDNNDWSLNRINFTLILNKGFELQSAFYVIGNV